MAFGTRRRTCAVSSSASHRSVAERALAHANPRLPSVSSAAQIEILKEKAALTDNWARKHEPYDAHAVDAERGSITYLADLGAPSRPDGKDWAHVEMFRKVRARSQEAADASRPTREGKFLKDIAPHCDGSALAMQHHSPSNRGMLRARLAPGAGVVIEDDPNGSPEPGARMDGQTRTEFLRPSTDLIPWADSSPINQRLAVSGRKNDAKMMIGGGAAPVPVERPGGWKKLGATFTSMTCMRPCASAIRSTPNTW